MVKSTMSEATLIVTGTPSTFAEIIRKHPEVLLANAEAISPKDDFDDVASGISLFKAETHYNENDFFSLFPKCNKTAERKRIQRKKARQKRKNPQQHYKHPEVAYNHEYCSAKRIRREKKILIKGELDEYYFLLNEKIEDNISVTNNSSEENLEAKMLTARLENLFEAKDHLQLAMESINAEIRATEKRIENLHRAE